MYCFDLSGETRRRISGLVTEPQWMCVDHYGRINCTSRSPIVPDDANFDTVIGMSVIGAHNTGCPYSCITLTASTADAHGLLMLPGLMDAHLHVMLTGEAAYYLDCQGCTSVAQLVDKVREHCSAHPDLPWIVGINWDQVGGWSLHHHHLHHHLTCVYPILSHCISLPLMDWLTSCVC